MRNRPALTAALAGLLAGGPVAAQPPAATGKAGGAAFGVVSTAPVPTGSSSLFPPPGSSEAVTPTPEVLERVNLRSEWTAYIPMENRADGLGPVQVVDGGQVFVQTRLGRLIALDAATGTTQWTFRYPEAYANLYPVGLTDRLVFAVNVNTLYCFDRYSGVREFAFDLPGLSLPGSGGPAAGPVADDRYVYLVLGSTRLAAFAYPTPLTAPGRQAAVGPDGRPSRPEDRGPALADQVSGRYAGSANLRIASDPNPFQRTQVLPRLSESGIGVGALQKTPSISALPRMTPPYSLAREITTPSVAVLPSLRQPYTLRPPHLRYNQQTPSIAVVPTSMASAVYLANLRPQPIGPVAVWSSASPGRTIYEPIQTRSDLWFTTEGPLAYALTKGNGGRQGRLELSAPISAPAAGPVAVGTDSLLGFFPQQDGAVLAVDLPGGTLKNPKVEWRANVGGYLNHKPVPTTAGIYASGDNAGVVRLDVLTGDVTWRTEATADRLLAVNDEFAYIRDRRGNLLIYPRALPNNPAAPDARPVARLDLRDFNVPVTNEVTDRILMGADNGLLVCLRDTATKYVRPVSIAPPSRRPPPEPKKDTAVPPAEPKGDL